MKLLSISALPVGTGIIYAGVNDARVHDNWFFDNWRSGVFLLAVPDAITSAGGAEGDIYPGVRCPGAPENGISTSCGNHFFNNKMGQVPAGFRFPTKLGQFGVPHSETSASVQPNGTDFWWDEFSGNTENCWFNNTGADGTADSVTGPGGAGMAPGAPPAMLPDCAGGQDPSSSVGPGDPVKTQYLVDCAESKATCDWYDTPPKPGSAQAASQARENAREARRFGGSAEAKRLLSRMERLSAGG